MHNHITFQTTEDGMPLDISESSIHERPAGEYTFLIIEA